MDNILQYIERVEFFNMNGDYKKLLAVIKSMKQTIHIPAVRKYIDLYYRKNGERKKEMIEYYFKVKSRNLNEY